LKFLTYGPKLESRTTYKRKLSITYIDSQNIFSRVLLSLSWKIKIDSYATPARFAEFVGFELGAKSVVGEVLVS